VKKKKDKVEKESIEKTEKNAKKPSKDKSNIEDKTFFKVALILCFTAAISALAASGVTFWKAQESIVTINKINKESTLDVYSKLVNTQLELIQKDINHTASLIQNNKLLYEMDDMAMSSIQEITKKSLPKSISVQVFLLGQYELNKEIYPPINFATHTQLLSSASSESSLPEFYKERLLALSDYRLTKDGCIVIKSQEHRSQELNRQAALERLAALILQVNVVKKTRMPTKPSRSSKMKRMDKKTKHGQTKALRGRVV